MGVWGCSCPSVLWGEALLEGLGKANPRLGRLKQSSEVWGSWDPRGMLPFAGVNPLPPTVRGQSWGLEERRPPP